MEVTNLNFLLKLIAMILNFINLILWCISDTHDNALGAKTAMQFLFAITVPAYIVILTGIMIMYLLDEEPGVWFQRLFIIVGIILFLIVGIIALVNCLDRDHGTYALIMAILCIVIGVLLIIDTLKAHGVF